MKKIFRFQIFYMVASGLVSQVRPQLHVRILSIAQDPLFITNNDGKRTPKHVSLPMPIKV